MVNKFKTDNIIRRGGAVRVKLCKTCPVTMGNGDYVIQQKGENMATFITNEILETAKEMVNEHLYEEQEEVDSLFGDEKDDRNKKITANLKLNFSQKAKGIEIKSGIDYILVPSTPAKKNKKTKKRLINTGQKELFGNDNKGKSNG